MAAVFAKNESLGEVFKATKKYLLTHGKPVSLYLDRDSIYKKNQRSMLDRASLTQFERAMEELNTKVIHARSPQAKGRVERLFG
ncbi:MAG: putative transposase protein, partial [uncultured bacterium]